MIGFNVLLIVTFFCFWIEYNKLKHSLNFKKLYVSFILLILLLGTFSILIYSLENLLEGKIDLEGDYQYYYLAAEDYLRTGRINALYPIYIKFIASFLFYGNIWLVRFANLLLLIIMYILFSSLLYDLKVSEKGYKYFSAFTLGNTTFYLTFSSAVRDNLILFVISVSIFILAKLWILYLRNKLNYMNLLFSITFLYILLYILFELQLGVFFASFIGILIYILETILTLSKSKCYKFIYLCVFLLLTVLSISYVLSISNIFNLYKAVVQEALFLEESKNGFSDNLLLSSARFILGPGLTRILFPNVFFKVFNLSFTALYFIGLLFWYVSLLCTVHLLVKYPLKFLKNPVSLYILCLIVVYIFMYSAAYGGSSLPRKRVYIYLLYNLFIAITYFTEYHRLAKLSFLDTKIKFNKFMVYCIFLLIVSIVNIIGVMI